MSKRILIVEDEPDVVDLIQINLKALGFQITTVDNGADALTKVQFQRPDLIILDLMIPKLSGLEVCKTLKKNSETAAIPIIILTAKSEEVDRIVGLELGADDYVTKPFSPRELALRVQSVLRRGTEKEASNEILVIGPISLDPSRHEVLLQGKPLELTATEFNLLALLMQRRGRVQNRDRLLNDVWGYETAIDTRTVDTHVRRLRAKLGKYADYIDTIRGVGYKFVETIS
jgi:two-component system phosphate regulon response regulator PhoB